jgi:hypothetical protein
MQMKKKAKPRKVHKNKKRRPKLLLNLFDVGTDVEVFPDEMFLWRNREEAKKKVSGLGQYLDRDGYDVSPGLFGMKLAIVQDSAAPGPHEYHCDPPVKDNPHIIIKARRSR